MPRKAVKVTKTEQATSDQEKKKALDDAKHEIAGLVMDVAGKVVGRALTDGDQVALVDGFIDSLGDET